MKNIAFSVTVSEEWLVSFIERANISYWGRVLNWVPVTLDLQIQEHEDGKVTLIQRRHWELALQLCAATFHNTFKDLMSGSGDMYTGDILIQLACFGEEKYS